MAAALRHEIPELSHDFASYFLAEVVRRFLRVLTQLRIQVLPILLQPQEPCHVVDAGAQEVDFLFLDSTYPAMRSRVVCTPWQSPTKLTRLVLPIAMEMAAIGLT